MSLTVNMLGLPVTAAVDGPRNAHFGVAFMIILAMMQLFVSRIHDVLQVFGVLQPRQEC